MKTSLKTKSNNNKCFMMVNNKVINDMHENFKIKIFL